MERVELTKITEHRLENWHRCFLTAGREEDSPAKESCPRRVGSIVQIPTVLVLVVLCSSWMEMEILN